MKTYKSIVTTTKIVVQKWIVRANPSYAVHNDEKKLICIYETNLDSKIRLS